MAEVATSIISKIAELLVEPTISQFRYLFCFKTIVDELKAEEEDLKLAMTRVENQVNSARNNAEVIEKDVEMWIAHTATTMKEVQRLKDEIQQDKSCFNKCCPNYLWRCRLSKKVAEMTSVLKKLVEKGKFTTVSHRAPLPEFLPSKDFTPSRSSIEALNQIMEALKDDNVSMIGLYGMGGVGKTTLAKEIANKVKELKLFDEVVFAVVSQNADYKNIQDQIADKLGLEFKERSVQGRAKHLTLRLQDERKKLVILDDVWKYLMLEDIGILFRVEQKNCKILLTTRLRNVCISMDCQRKIPLNILNEYEALALLKKNADLRNDSSALHDMAKKVAKECKGLPIAIVTVGRALKQKETLWEWQEALRKLRASRLTEIRDMDEEKNAYACLKFSFDVHREETRSCLLLCSLYPEDSKIFVEDLVVYALGLNLYKEAQTMEITRNEVLGAIADLKNSCMLLETEKEGYVKMHDMVRDFTLWIGSQVEKVFIVNTYAKFSEWQRDPKFNDYKAVSIMGDAKEDYSNGLVCPKLELLLLRCGKSSVVDYDFFEEVKQLKVVSLIRASLSLQSLKFLNNLQVLKLKYCKIKDNFGPTLMMLKRLQILRCWDLDIEELPTEVGELENLKVLDLQGCRKIQRISFGIIQKLCKLEELYLGDSFSKWASNEVMSEETRNVSLIELNWVPHLAILWLRLEDTKQIPRDFVFPKLSGYSIHVNCSCHEGFANSLMGKEISTRRIGHPKPNQLCVEASKVNACKNLLENVRELKLSASNSSSFGNLMPDIDASGLNDLISLDVRYLETECLVDATLWQKQQVQPMIGFSNLNKLHVKDATIKEICNGQPPQGFLKRLKDFGIFYCHEIITAFPENQLRQPLQSLQEIEIDHCRQLQAVFQLQAANIDDNGGGERPIGVKEKTKEEEKDYLLTHLTKLRLSILPNLRYIWKGTTHHVSLKGLTSLTLFECNLKSIFSPSLAQSLLRLQKLEIVNCRQLKHVISVTEMEEETSLSKGKDVCNDLKLPNLISIDIRRCPNLEYVFPISIAPQGLPRLADISLWGNDELKSVFENETNNNTSTTTTIDLRYYLGPPNTISLPTLKFLYFGACPKLLMYSVAKIWILQKPLTCSKQSANDSSPHIIQLRDLELEGCNEMEHVIVMDEKDRLFFITHFQVEPHRLACFSNLSRIIISNCNRLKSLFPIMLIISGLPKLSELEIKECYELVEVFDGVEDEANKDIIQPQQIFFQKLSSLILYNLPSLINFCPLSYHFIFPYLESLKVKGCPQLRTIFTITPDKTVHSKAKTLQEASSLISVDIDWQCYSEDEDEDEDIEEDEEDEDEDESL